MTELKVVGKTMTAEFARGKHAARIEVITAQNHANIEGARQQYAGAVALYQSELERFNAMKDMATAESDRALARDLARIVGTNTPPAPPDDTEKGFSGGQV